MGKFKDRFLELVEKNIIEWSDEHQFYVLKEGNKNKQFDLAEYLSTVDINEKIKVK